MESKMHGGAQKPLFQMARENRNNATPAEEILWNYLKTKPLGIKFRRQHPYSVYILDFYCHALKLIIEVDGSIHNLEEVKKNDPERENLLKKDGLNIIRFTNDEVFCSLEKVKDTIIFNVQKIVDDKKR
jgi:cyclase